ncbi:DUF4355 domain-containing protein [Helcococcus kunzii]|uniref:capsid assembly scaffolding protein Gp46 family protein n=1 Tax=Helcococcus kunzii TaxID=40091 RepID=UPI0038AB5624
MAEFKIIETQEEFDKRIAERLQREKEKFQNQINDLTEERDSLKIQMGEKDKALEEKVSGSESLNKKIEELNGEISTYKIKDMKRKIALQNGIPYDLADRLTGTNEEELKKDAEKLAGFINKPSVAPLKSTEPKGASFEGKDLALLEMSKNLTNRGE